MTDVYSYRSGTTPLIISVPHDGRSVPEQLRRRMTPAGRDLPDTDWHVARLYEFAAGEGATMLVAGYSRYVVDLNRSADDSPLYPGQLATGLCPQKTFDATPIYRPGEEVQAAERQERVRRYWRPYHDRLQQALGWAREAFGYALLWDAHSIPGSVPLLFDGELPALNLGTFDGQSCAPELAHAVAEEGRSSPYDTVVDGRFKGGYITRHYGEPARNIHAIQLEIAQRHYMDEASREYDEQRAAKLRRTLKTMLRAYTESARALHR